MNSPFADDIKQIPIPKQNGREAFNYILDDKQLWALRAALATGRPLLITGEPGVGKTQLALAAAEYLKWNYYYEPISARTEAENLLWWYDAVARLGEAQIIKDHNEAKARLKEANFVTPGIIWKAFSPQTARERLEVNQKKSPEFNPIHTGSVLLLDEIDKADSDVPNSLLDVLDLMRFDCPYVDEPIELETARDKLLVIITSNQERELPAAFIRRCVVLKMAPDEEDMDTWLTERAEAHFDPNENNIINTEVIQKAIQAFIEDREAARGQSIKPGLAEFLDLLTALNELADNPQQALETLGSIRSCTIGKSNQVG